MEYLILAAYTLFVFFCGWKARGKQKTVVMRPSGAQWALCESLAKDHRTIARLKMQLTHEAEANADLRDRLAVQEIELQALRDTTTHHS